MIIFLFRTYESGYPLVTIKANKEKTEKIQQVLPFTVVVVGKSLQGHMEREKKQKKTFGITD